MKRLRIAVAIAFAALVVAGVTAAPALADQGGNSDAAHACQHDGWQTMDDPATGQPFTNQGDCVSSAAHSTGASLVVTATVSGDGRAWGFVIGSGLNAGGQWSASVSRPMSGLGLVSFVNPDGTINEGPLWACGQGWGDFQASSTTAGGDPISSNTIATSPCG